MSCNNCVRHVTEALQGVAGVANAQVVLDTNRATVRWIRGAAPDVGALLEAIKRRGYEAQPAVSLDHGQKRQSSWHLNLWIGVAGTVPLMLGEWVLGLHLESWFRWLSFGLATMVQLWAGGSFYRGAWNQLKAGRSNMDTLVSLGSTTAYVYSTWALFSGRGDHLYFMEAAAIITLISVGHWIEARVSAKASHALQALLNLAPATARRRRPDKSEEEVGVADLQVNDLVVLAPGARVPTDGEVTEGESAVDESMLTGESVPADKAASARLYAGTVNLNGRLLMRVTATGEETALAHIIAAVQRAQTSRANIQRLADQISNVFVPVVVLVALATALWWGLAPESAWQVHHALSAYLWPVHPPETALAAAVIGAAAVLIIACPCAMGLATPAAIMAGSNAAARRGILVRDGVALEKAGRITAVVFDKTGTLTAGKPAVVKYAAMQTGYDPGLELIPLAAALARHSTHPISQAIAKLAPNPPSVSAWQEIRGAGLQGKLPSNGDKDGAPLLRLGALKWLDESGVDLSSSRAFVDEWATQGATLLGLAADRALLGLLAVKDTLKTGAGAVIQQLQSQGLKVYLMTGDNRLTALGIARQTNIPQDHVFAEVRPEQKAEWVRKLQGQAERVAFVGDGINDAPALEQADLGVAVSRASDIAREAADIILLKSEIEAVPESLGLARATLRTIKQNLFWAFFYNAVGVPLAALGFMSPVLCALAMGVSDLLVIGNALRLRFWRMPAQED
jgi:Cu+-exporting ATPase